MAKNNQTKAIDTSTEEKIKEAAKVVFLKKGYAATRTRDIAEQAEINLALLNYYFRSKEKLFNIIMSETVSKFMQGMVVVLNNEETSLKTKVEHMAEKYIDFILLEPNVPMFILSEIRNNPEALSGKLPVRKLFLESVFVKQYQKAVEMGEITEPNPLHFLVNLLGLVIFPFVIKPMLQHNGVVSESQFEKLMQERKRLIPIWIEAMMKA